MDIENSNELEGLVNSSGRNTPQTETQVIQNNIPEHYLDPSVVNDNTVLLMPSEEKAEFKKDDQIKNDETKCKVCGETVLSKNLKDHRTTFKHIEAQKQKWGETECTICKEKFPKGYWKQHKNTKTHIAAELQKEINKIDETTKEIECHICKEKYPKGSWKQHKNTKTHILAVQQKEINKTDEIIKASKCPICKEKFPKGSWKKHKTTEIHILAEEKKEKKNTKEIKCHICKEKFPKGSWKQHKTTETHIVAKEQKKVDKIVEPIKENECPICKEMFSKGNWENHKTTKIHIAAEVQKEMNKISETEVYTLRLGSDENQQYTNTFTTFLAVRFALSTIRDFKISVNNDKWSDFGDIVFEFDHPEKTIEAIRCKKIETKYKYTPVVLTAESGKLSLKEQCEILKKLKHKDDLVNANFKLYTVSSVKVDKNPKVVYDESDVQKWQSDDKESWKGVKAEIKQSTSKKKDLFNTTDDADDVCTFHMVNHRNESVNEILSKFQMYIKQKQRPEMMLYVDTIIKDKLNIDSDISGKLLKYVQGKFKTDKVLKKDERCLKVTRENVLVKIAEILLTPFLVVPHDLIQEKDLDLWKVAIKEFDITFLKHEEDTVTKIYQCINHVLKQETNYYLNIFREVEINTEYITNEKLKKELFGYDNSLKFLYLAMWKSGLTPLILRAQDPKQLRRICSVVTFLKEEKFRLEFVVTTDFKPNQRCLPEKLKVFWNMSDLKFLQKKVFENILSKNIKVVDLNCQVSLKEIHEVNCNFLKKLSPDAFLNILFDDYSFVNVQVPMTKEIVDNTIVLGDDVIKQLAKYWNERDESTEKELKYLVSVDEEPTYIHVPPQL